jgi:REP element-mobilizing transposase RayT
MDLPQRKHPRLKHYDYSQNGCYFLTLCTKEKACVLGKVISDANGSPAVSLSAMGETVRTVLMEMADYSTGFQIDHYVIMPNHLHLILTLDDFGGQGTGRPTVMSVVHYLKRTVTKRLGISIWQPSFYEHVIRNRGSYEEIHNYITGNPGKWLSSPEVTL